MQHTLWRPKAKLVHQSKINKQPEIVPHPVQHCKKWPISTRSHLKRTVAATHMLCVNNEVTKKVSEVENYHSKQFDWVKRFQPVNIFSLKTVKRLSQKQQYCELRNCRFSAYSNSAMADHLATAHPRYACEECEFETYNKSSFYSHRIYKHDKKKKLVLQIKTILYCHDCSFQTFHQKTLDSHKFTHSKTDPEFQVETGKKRQSSKRKPVSVSTSKTPKRLGDFKMLSCNWCSYQTIYKKNLRNHEGNVHINPIKDKPTLQKFSCQQCPFMTLNQARLKKHCMVFKHKFVEVKTYHCPICPYTSNSESNLTKHFLKHGKKRKVGIKSPLSCEDCPFETYNKGSFEKHSIVFKHSEVAVCETKFVKEYACPLCPYKSRSERGRLNNHMPLHLDARPFQCCQCEYKAKTKTGLRGHTRKKHTNYKTVRKHPCRICERRYRTGSELNKHLKCHLKYPTKVYPKLGEPKQDRYLCDKCPFKAKHMSGIVAHRHKHSDERPFPCEFCDRRFKIRRTLNDHLARHNRDNLEKIYKCSSCKRAYAFRKDWMAHEKNHELRKTKRFACTLCEYKASLPEGLAGHMRNMHSDERPYKCDMCPYAFKVNKTLKNHKKYIHEKLKRPEKTTPNAFKCTYTGCNFTTIQQFSLDVHVRTHTGEKPLSCEFCEYKSGNPAAMILHRRTHTDERPYACTQCEFKSRSLFTLTNHMRTHTGERPFGCDQCGYRATQKQSLARHVYNMHTSKEEKEAIVQAKALAPKTWKGKKGSMNIEAKEKENNSKNIEVAKTKPKRAKPWRNPITTKPERKEKGDDKGVDQKKRKRSKKVVVSESSENEESEGGAVSDVSLSENEAASGEKNDFVVEENTIIKKKSKKVPKNKTMDSKEKAVFEDLKLELSASKETDNNLSGRSLRKRAPEIDQDDIDVLVEEKSDPNDGARESQQDVRKLEKRSRKETEKSPVVKARNSNRRSNTQSRRRERIQIFALKKQKDSIQTKQNESYIPYTALPTNSSETVLLNEKDKLEHLKKMTDDMWGSIFNQ